MTDYICKGVFFDVSPVFSTRASDFEFCFCFVSFTHTVALSISENRVLRDVLGDPSVGRVRFGYVRFFEQNGRVDPAAIAVYEALHHSQTAMRVIMYFINASRRRHARDDRPTSEQRFAF